MKLPPPAVLAKLPRGTPVRGEALGVELPEKEFQKAVRALAESLGWSVYSIPDSRRATAGGYPDLTAYHPTRTGPVTLFVAELKRVGQKPRKDQAAWLRAFRLAGIPAYVWKPTDWQEIRRVLGG